MSTQGEHPAAAMAPADLAELLSTFNDVTARLQRTHETLHAEVARLKDQLREANEQLDRSKRLAALGEMAAGIAHEIRNPLGSIGLHARMLADDLHDRPPERLIAGKIGEAVRRLNQVVTDVLSFARDIRPRLQQVPVDELFDSVLEQFGAVAAHATVRIDRTPRARRRPAMIVCDPSLAAQCLANVVGNAIEAMAESATGSERVLTLDAAQRRIVGAGARPQERTAIIVRDTGPGIRPEVKARMFNPFFTTRAAGTGLGLAIVHRIMDAHGGGVAVYNTSEAPGAARAAAPGATVELQFPSRAATDQADAPTVSIPNELATEGSLS